MKNCILLFVISFGLITTAHGMQEGETKTYEERITINFENGHSKLLAQKYVEIWETVAEAYNFDPTTINVISIKGIETPYKDIPAKEWENYKDSGSTILDKCMTKYTLLPLWLGAVPCSLFMYYQRNNQQAALYGFMAATASALLSFLGLICAAWLARCAALFYSPQCITRMKS